MFTSVILRVKPRILQYGFSPARAGMLVLLSLAVGCQTPPSEETAVSSASSPATTEAPALPVASADHYRIVSEDSSLRLLLFRGGPLAKYGHNHVIIAKGLRGDVYLASEFHDSGFRLRVPVAGFRVDPESARAEEGDAFATELSTQAKEKTRDNMLGPDVLDAANHPDIEIRSLAINGPEWGPDITVRVTLRGVTRDLTVPVAAQHDGDRLRITGTTELKQTDFDITPFSVMGGGLQVRDSIRIRFRITAVKGEE